MNIAVWQTVYSGVKYNNPILTSFELWCYVSPLSLVSGVIIGIMIIDGKTK